MTEDELADAMYRIGTALNEKVKELFDDEKIDGDLAASMCFGWGIGAAMSCFGWSPEETGVRAKETARNIQLNATAVFGEDGFERLKRIKSPTKH